MTRTNRIVYMFVTLGIAFLIAFTSVVLINNKTFVDKVYFKTHLDNAKGLSAKPPIYFKGLEIGRIADFQLDELTNDIQVDFYIFVDYQDKIVRHAVLSGNQSVLLNDATEFDLIMPAPLNGYSIEPLAAGAFVPYINSEVGQSYIQQGLIAAPVNSVDSIITSVNNLLNNLQRSNNPEAGSIFKILDNMAIMSEQLLVVSQHLSNSHIIQNSQQLLENANQSMSQLPETQQKIDDLLTQSQLLIQNLQTLSQEYQNPTRIMKEVTEGQVPLIMDNVNQSLTTIKALLDEVYAERLQLTVTVNTMLKVMNKMDKTLQGVNNNPLLKGGIDKTPPPKGIEMND